MSDKMRSFFYKLNFPTQKTKTQLKKNSKINPINFYKKHIQGIKMSQRNP